MACGRSASEVLKRCAEGRDGEAWREFDRRFRGRIELRILRVLRQQEGNGAHEEVEDLIQEFYCHLLEGGGRRLTRCRGRSDGEIEHYLARVAERVTRDDLRRRRALKRGSGRPRVADFPRLEALPDGAGDPEQQLLREEARRRFLQLCRELLGEGAPARHLAILRLALLEGWSSREISARLEGTRPSSVDSVIHRFKLRLATRGLTLPRRAAERRG